MKLRYSKTSPYVRKVMLVALETGLDKSIELETTNAWAPDTDLPRDNPLSKVPALISDGGEALYDSPVICEYLDSLHGGRKLFPAFGGTRWTALRRQALADGILDAALQLRIETMIRPAEFLWQGWLDRQAAAVNRSLDALEEEALNLDGLSTIGEITIVAALGYLDFRNSVGEWRGSRPKLAAWAADVAKLASVEATVPRG